MSITAYLWQCCINTSQLADDNNKTVTNIPLEKDTNNPPFETEIKSQIHCLPKRLPHQVNNTKQITNRISCSKRTINQNIGPLKKNE